MKARLVAAEDSYKPPFNTLFSNIYKSDKYITCYNFCQKCKDHFTTAGGKKSNRTLFAISFFHDCIGFRCQIKQNA